MIAGLNGRVGRTGRVFLAASACYGVSSMALWLQPLLVSDYVSNRGMSPSDAGLIASAEMITIAVAMMAVSRLATVVRFLPAALGGLAVSLVGTIACIFVEQFALLLVLRITVALGFSIMSLVSSMAIAGLPNAQAFFGRMYIITLIASAALLASLPAISLALGSAPGFKALLVFGVLLLPLILVMPADAVSFSGRKAQGVTVDRHKDRAIFFLAAGLGVLALVYAAVWAFFVILAKRSGLDAAEANTATALCLMAAMAGSFLSPYFARLVGDRRAIPGAMLLVSISLAGVILSAGPLTFQIAACMTLMSLYLLFPAVLGASSELDPSGRGAGYVNASMILLAAMGPYLGGFAMTWAGPAFQACIVAVAGLIAILMHARFSAVKRAMESRPPQGALQST